jgi:hypothetical protein
VAFFLLVAANLALALPMLEVKGSHLVTENGKPARLRGVNIPSLEWGQGEHLFQSLDVAINDWHASIIRLPVSQDRWFGHSKEQNDGGTHYRSTVHEFIARAAASGCYVILDLHWSDGGKWGESLGQHKMPDANSVSFWEDAAPAFANQPAVLFGLYNEPYGVSWSVWRNGGRVMEEKKDGAQVEYDSPGMQTLLDTCRAKGARNVALAGGLDWSYDLSSIPKGSALADPTGHGVIYDVHFYPMKKDWDKHVTPAAEAYPVLVGELGDGTADWLAKVQNYIAAHRLPWIAWSFHPGAKPCLIKDWKYTPTPFGETIKAALNDGP